MVPTSNNSTAASSNTPTAEQIAQAQALLAQVAALATSTSNAPDADTIPVTQSETPLTEQPVETVTAEVQVLATPAIEADPEVRQADTDDGQPLEVPDQALPPIDQAQAATIRRLVEVAINSAFYMSNPKRVDALKASLKIPVSDDKSFSQFFVHSDKDLNAAAGKIARQKNDVPEEITNAQIIAEAQKRYFAKHGKNAIVNEEYLAQ